MVGADSTVFCSVRDDGTMAGKIKIANRSGDVITVDFVTEADGCVVPVDAKTQDPTQFGIEFSQHCDGSEGHHSPGRSRRSGPASENHTTCEIFLDADRWFYAQVIIHPPTHSLTHISARMYSC